MTRYSPSRNYLWAGIVAVALAVFSGWSASQWSPATIPAVLFLISAALMFVLASRPAIEIHPQWVRIGNRAIPWSEIRRVDRTGWLSPLIVSLTLADDSRRVLVYPGDLDSANSLLRHLRRASTRALIDGIPYALFWGEGPLEPSQGAGPSSPRYKVLREEDEAEVERLFQLLKTVGHLDSSNSGDEK